MEQIEVDLEAILNGERPCDRENDTLSYGPGPAFPDG